jgi:hypothetical protein
MCSPPHSSALRTLAGGLLGASTLVAFGACAKNDSVDIVLLDPNGYRSQAKYEQLAIFDGACPSDQLLAYGLIGSAEVVQTISSGDEFADIGALSKSAYGFAVLLRLADCSVIAAGCTPVDLSVHRHITIQVDPVLPPSGACNTAVGETCSGGLCK